MMSLRAKRSNLNLGVEIASSLLLLAMTVFGVFFYSLSIIAESRKQKAAIAVDNFPSQLFLLHV